jgi:hypothetical protein
MNNEKYILIKPEENCGMCGYIWQTIRGIYHNPNEKYYIDFSNSIYKSGINSLNIWDQFFEQPHIEVSPTPEQIKKQVGIIFDSESEFIWPAIQPNTPDNIQKRREEFNTIINKFIKLKPHVQQKINSFVENNFKGKRILGVHLRGTDHPEKKKITEYMQPIKDKLVNYDKLFVCSDDHERFRLAEVAFKHKIISYNSLRSTKKGIPLHSHPYDSRYLRDNTPEYQYKIAEDVIIEAFLMSKVDFLFCCPGSNVNYLARAINSKLECMEL